MTTMFRRFEIQSELSKSDTAMIYKALDTETNQIVALKTQNLAPLGDGADAFVERLIAEGEKAGELGNQNLVSLYGAGGIEGQFCAAMEYIQGNSVGTMLARKEGFSIWDLLDITRQVCSGLDYAASKDVVHHSLEPAKIMVQWDGMVKILGYGISNMSLISAESGKGLGRLLPYCSPEQIRGEALDVRSNLFTLGTILYEMVAARKAFDSPEPTSLLGQIENEVPPSPSTVNAKIQPAVSALIMKALAKDPAARYQQARELLEDLEKCKENSKKGGPEAKKVTTAPAVAIDPAVRAVAASKFVSTGASGQNAAPSAPSLSPRATPEPPPGQSPRTDVRAAAAAAGAGTAGSGTRISTAGAGANSRSTSKSDSNSGARLISDFEVTAPQTMSAAGPVISGAAQPETRRVATDPMMSVSAVSGPVKSGPMKSSTTKSSTMITDPMMSEPAMSAAGSGKSFSDLAEMPPLKEAVFEPPPPQTIEPSRPTVQIYPKKTGSKKDEKPGIQAREVAEKAIKEIATVPPRLMIYSMLGAVALILAVVIFIFFHVRSEDDGSTAAPRAIKAVSPRPNPPVSPIQPTTAQTAPAIEAQTPQTPRPEPGAETQPSLSVRQLEKRTAKNGRRSAAAVAVAVPGLALIDSNPPGAQVQIDGKSDAAWVTPINLTGLTPGKHIISASKTGYTSEIRALDVVAGNKASLLFHLSPMNAIVVINSTPPGAAITMDGRSTGRVTPAQFGVEKGSHTVSLRKTGYLDESATADLAPGQNFQYAPVLRALGNTEDLRTVGKFNKLFGHGGESTAGMGAISVHTQPKGAQVVINQRVLDKTSPVEVMLGPGNYVVDITMTGFKSVHKIVNVDKGGKAAIDEILERQ
jgi:serine/threonine protein kinase